MKYQSEPYRIFCTDDAGKCVAEITFPETEAGVCCIDHTFVDDSLRAWESQASWFPVQYSRFRQTGSKSLPRAPMRHTGWKSKKEAAKMYKNIEKQAVLQLKDLVEYQTGQVVSKTLVQNDKVSMTIFSFDKGEEISTHAAGGDAMVTVLEGTGKFTVGGEVFLLHAGETLIMPKDIPHAVYGEEQFKMQLIVSF